MHSSRRTPAKGNRMRTLVQSFDRVDKTLTHWMAAHGIFLLRVSLGIVFLWFGALKFFPELSPAEELAQRTIQVVTFGAAPRDVALIVLALWECAIGIGLLFGIFLRATLVLLWLQMPGTLLPLFIFPHDAFIRIPYAPSLEGQYIIKNLVLLSASIVIGATVRGGRVVAEPEETGNP